TRDPSFALAYSGLSDCHLFRSAELPPRETMERAKDAAQKALFFDNSLAEAHTSLARVKQFYDWDWPGAEAEFRRAIDLDPNYAPDHAWYANDAAGLGREDEAVKEIHRGRELDPTSLIITCDVGSLLRDNRHYDEAIDVYRSVITMDPSFARVHL